MRTILASIAALAACSIFVAPAGATTNPTADVTLRCVNRTVVATFTYTGFSPQNNLTAEQRLSGAVSATSTHSFSGPGSSDTLSVPLPAGAGPFTVNAVTGVLGGGGRLKASDRATVTCTFRKPPPPPDRVRPSARFWGPCGDPYYRAVLNNRRSDKAVTFTVRATTFRHPNWVHKVRVPAHRRVWTGLFDAAGGTRMTVRAGGELLASRRAAPNRMYPSCPAGVPVIG